jgi:hypothetical protein
VKKAMHIRVKVLELRQTFYATIDMKNEEKEE